MDGLCSRAIVTTLTSTCQGSPELAPAFGLRASLAPLSVGPNDPERKAPVNRTQSKRFVTSHASTELTTHPRPGTETDPAGRPVDRSSRRRAAP